jgi:hypothetical protein
LGKDCEPHADENFEMVSEMKFGQNETMLVNLKDGAYKHRLVYGEVCKARFVPEGDEKFELLLVSLIVIG